MISVYVLVTVLITSCASKMSTRNLTAPIDALRVYQGVEDITSKYAYVVSIQSMPVGHKMREGMFIDPKRICTGSLITASWVLTAAHCCTKKAELIQYGNMSIPVTITQFKKQVLRRIPHPHYITGRLAPNDIGLLLISPVHIDKYGNVSALDYTTLLGSAVEFVGYGLTFLPKKRTKHMPLKFLLDLFRQLQIGEAVVSSCQFLFKGHICISPKCSLTQLTIHGDSGGPMVYDHKIVGLVTGALDDNYSNTDRYFTPVSLHVTWIYNVMNPRINKKY